MADTLAELVVKLRADARPLAKGLAQAQTSVRSIQKSILNVRSAFAVVAGSAGVGLLAKNILDIGAAAEETRSKFQTVFGQATNDVDAFVDSFGLMAGLSRTAARDLTATIGAIGQGMGIAQEQSGEFAKELVKLSADIASFNNRETAEVSRAITSALTGEREAIKQFGIVINEADVQTRALASSGKAAASALTQQEKAYATMALIAERAGVAVGDLARTQESAANQARRVRAQFENVRDTIATGLLPTVALLLPELEKLSTRLLKTAESLPGWIAAVKDAFADNSEASRALDAATKRAAILAENLSFDGLQSKLNEAAESYNAFGHAVAVAESELARASEGLSQAQLLYGATGDEVQRLSASLELLRNEQKTAGETVRFLSEQMATVATSAAQSTDALNSAAQSPALKTLAKDLDLANARFAAFGDQQSFFRESAQAYRDALNTLLEEGLSPTSETVKRLTLEMGLFGGSFNQTRAEIDAAQKAMVEFALRATASLGNIGLNSGPLARTNVEFSDGIKKELDDVQKAGQQVFNNLTLNIGRAVDDWKDALRSFKDFFIQTFLQLGARELLSRVLPIIGGAIGGGFGGFLTSLVTDDIPNVNPALATAGAPLDFSTFPAARNTLEAARDRDWQAFLSESQRQGRINGHRYS